MPISHPHASAVTMHARYGSLGKRRAMRPLLDAARRGLRKEETFRIGEVIQGLSDAEEAGSAMGGGATLIGSLQESSTHPLFFFFFVFLFFSSFGFFLFSFFFLLFLPFPSFFWREMKGRPWNVRGGAFAVVAWERSADAR